MAATIEEIIEFLSKPRKIAVVGASNKKHKAGYYVPKFLLKRGWQIIPINPNLEELFNVKPLNSLSELNENVDGVIIYRRQDIVEPYALKAVEMNIPVIWLPDNITCNKAMKLAEEKGLIFIQDRCPKRDMQNLID